MVKKLDFSESEKENINQNNSLPDDIKNKKNIYVIYQIIQILSKWIHYFTMCASFNISNIKENLNYVIKQIVYNRPTGLKIGIEQNLNQTQMNSSKDSSPSQTTPTFGSPHSSFSEGVKQVSIKQKSYLQIGFDENDNFLDEDGAHKYFSKLIYANFHLCIMQYFQFSQKIKNLNEIQQDYELIYLNFLEILILYNEMK